MKALFAALALAFSVSASAATEVVVLDGYTGPSKYNLKTVTTVEDPAVYIYLEPMETAGYCFNGDVNEVVDVLKATMANLGPAEFNVTASDPVADETSVGDPLILENVEISFINDEGKLVKWQYPQLRPCSRKSKQ